VWHGHKALKRAVSVWSRMCCCIAGVSRLIDSWVGPLGDAQTQLLPCRGRSTSHIALITSGHACTAHLGSGAPSDASVLGGPLLSLLSASAVATTNHYSAPH
jgi:hypothetical protein